MFVDDSSWESFSPLSICRQLASQATRTSGDESRALLPHRVTTRFSWSPFSRVAAARAVLATVGVLALGAVASISLTLDPSASRAKLLTVNINSGGLRCENKTQRGATASMPTTAANTEDARHIDEQEHIRGMHDACVMHDEAIIPWRVGLPDTTAQAEDQETVDAMRVLYRGDPRVLDELRRCPDVDVLLPSDARGRGLCQDGSAYATYLESRLVPHWVLHGELNSSGVSYHDLCPDTPMLVFDHYWDPREWPDSKSVYLVSSIDVKELTARHLWHSDVVLCKTETCLDRVSKWYEQQGNPRGASVVLTKQTSLDATVDAQRVLGPVHELSPKDFGDHVRFTHMADSSRDRGTDQVLQCWLSRPDLPPLDVYIHDALYDTLEHDGTAAQAKDAHNMNIVVGRLDTAVVGHILVESAFFLCPSTREGYGHYINQARAAGGVVVTTDAHPMNELIASGDTGVLVETMLREDPEALLGGAYKGDHGLKMAGERAGDGLGADFGWQELCGAVDFVLQNTTVRQRELMGAKAQRAYHEDTKFFARRMLELRELARE